MKIVQFLRQSVISNNQFLFRQLFDRDSCTYTYLIADNITKDAILIDPVYEKVSRDLTIIQELCLNLRYAMSTHVHADHVTGTGEIKKHLPQCRSVISENSRAKADICVRHMDHLEVGTCKLRVLETPGHTNGCVTYYWPDNNMAFTGDALLIRGCGRTDFQEGCSKKLYNSVHRHIFSLPECTNLYPAHDYNGQTVTTVGEEKQFNLRLTKSIEEFIKIMDNLKLEAPQMLDRNVEINKNCGFS